MPTLALVYVLLGANAAKIAHQRRTADVAFWSSMLIRRGLPNARGSSVGSTIDLGLVRGGALATLKVILGERPIR